MQIHEVTLLKEQTPTTLGGMVGSSIMGGLSRVMGAGQQDPAKMAAANQAKIDDVAKRALPMWLAKQSQIAQTMGTANFDEELEAWIEQNMLQGRLHVEDLDPAYQSKIKSQIKIVNSIPDADLNRKRAEFSKLIAATMLARPARSQAGRVTARTTSQNVIQSVLAMAGARLSSAQARSIGDGFKAQGINNIPRSTIADIARNDAQAVETMLSAMGITIT